ncbi:2-hydroxyacid dehydrogenase [Streptomyces sp. BE230]|uniref:2-hydroxyacid dehydrogenase n=1 Tax=Streptomyces sp. BE230 TaxID=3002526 RepID=UPI002ED480E5|nr:2-hydroxyacid dehydrogenase [Streptomyces sp. BE230]
MSEYILWIGESDESVLAILRSEIPGGFELLIPESGTPTQAELRKTTYILNGSGRVSGEHMRMAPNLRMVQRLGAGLDGVDVDTARELGIDVANLTAMNSAAVAEHTLLLALASARHLCALHGDMTDGRWSPNDQLSQTFELDGRTFGIVGFGNIGREVARRAHAFGMNIRYFDPRRAPAEVEAATGAVHTPLHELLTQSDVVSIHVPLTPQTSLLISDEELASMKPGSILVNVSRAGIVDEAALLKHLESGHLGAAGVDVWAQEPVSPSDPLLAAPNVIATPHVAAQTRDTVVRCFRAALSNIERSRGEALSHA